MANPNVYFPGEAPPPQFSTDPNAISDNTQAQLASSAASLAIDSYIHDFADHMSRAISGSGDPEDIVGLFFDPLRKFYIKTDSYEGNNKKRLLENGWVPLAYTGDNNTVELTELLQSTQLYLGISGLRTVPRSTITDLSDRIPQTEVYTVKPKYTLPIVKINAPNVHPYDGVQQALTPPPPAPPEPLTEEEKQDIANIDGANELRVIEDEDYMELAFQYGFRTRPPEADTTVTNVVWVRVALPTEIHPLDLGQGHVDAQNLGISIYAAVLLQGGESRIHFKPEDATAVLKTASSLFNNTIEGLEWVYAKVAGFVDAINKKLGKYGVLDDPATIACCLIQTLSAYTASQTKHEQATYDTSDTIAKIENITDNLILVCQAAIQMSIVPNMDTQSMWNVLLNITAIIYNAATVAVSGTLLFAWREVAMFIFNTIQKWYKDMTTKPELQQALFSGIRCFALDEMFLKLVEAFTQKSKQIVSELASSFRMIGTAAAMPTLSNGIYAPTPQLLYLRALLVVLRAIRDAVSRGELCLNRGFTDIPNGASRNSAGTGGANGGTDNGDLARGAQGDGAGSEDGFTSLFSQVSPLSENVYAPDQTRGANVTGSGGSDGSSFGNPDQSAGTQTSTFGVAGPTDDEMVGFFVKYLNMSSTEARATIRRHADNRNCKEKLTSEQAGQLGAILMRVGLEL
jgi:hypothetical protein